MASRHHTFEAPSAARAAAARSGAGIAQPGNSRARRSSTLLLLFELGEMRAELALVLLAFGAVALGLASYWPTLAWLEAALALLALPVAAVVMALRRSIIDTPWLRRAALVVGGGSALLALSVALGALAVAQPFGQAWREVGARYVPIAAGLLAAVGFGLQLAAERARARSWLLVGSWAALGFALWAPRGWDPATPGWSAIGILLIAALGGGGAGGAVSYVIARLLAPADPHARATPRG